MTYRMVCVAVIAITLVTIAAMITMIMAPQCHAEPWFPFSLFKEGPIDWMDVINPTEPPGPHDGCFMLMPEAWRCPDPPVQR